ncbi:hypothetical protein RIF29_25091 [Crotalaria pallida]|uniref:Uncharacterized protein n=1 Tax=Crotalaria pallida TaxID=3830 RepID=A0AAN9ELQ5_CROPI
MPIVQPSVQEPGLKSSVKKTKQVWVEKRPKSGAKESHDVPSNSEGAEEIVNTVLNQNQVQQVNKVVAQGQDEVDVQGRLAIADNGEDGISEMVNEETNLGEAPNKVGTSSEVAASIHSQNESLNEEGDWTPVKTRSKAIKATGLGHHPTHG